MLRSFVVVSVLLAMTRIVLAEPSATEVVQDFVAICVVEMPSLAAANERAAQRGFAPSPAFGTPTLFREIKEDLRQISGAERVLSKFYNGDGVAFLAAGRSAIGSGERSSNCMLSTFLVESHTAEAQLIDLLSLGDVDEDRITSGMTVKLWDIDVEGFPAFVRLSRTLKEGRGHSFDLALFVFD